MISNTSSRKGNADISFFGADGIKISQGYYSKDGLADGKVTNYYKNGQVASDGSCRNGLQEGKKTFYYANQKLSQEGNYKADKADGYFINYYNNSQVLNEGWYVNDQRQGTFINNDLLGNTTSKLYYLNDRIHGISEYYTPTGKPDYKEYYDNGWFNKVEQYDSTGKIMVSSELNKGEGKVRFNHFNGKPYFESNYKFYKLNGVYTVTNGDGSKDSVSYYKDGSLDSVYTAWYPNGKIQVEGKYDQWKQNRHLEILLLRWPAYQKQSSIQMGNWMGRISNIMRMDRQIKRYFIRMGNWMVKPGFMEIMASLCWYFIIKMTIYWAIVMKIKRVNWCQ